MVGIEPTPDLINKHWIDMPEFVQEKVIPFATVEVRFDNEEELQKFAEIIGQNLTNKTKSAWYPQKSHYNNKDKKEWINES